MELSALEVLGVFWIGSVLFLTAAALGSWALNAWRRRRNTLGHIDRYVVPEATRGLVERMRREEDRP